VAEQHEYSLSDIDSKHPLPESTMAGLEPDPDYRDKEMSEAVGDFALHLYVYWSKKHSNEAERIGKMLRDWDYDFYALLEPEEDPTQHLKDSKNRANVLNKLKELEEQHTAEFVGSFLVCSS